MKSVLKKINFLDYSILIPYLMLSLVGIVMVFSTTIPYQLARGLSPYKLVINQAVFIILSFAVTAVLYKVKLSALKNRKLVLSVLIILVISMVYSRFGPGTAVNGAHRWIQIPGIGTVQPAEFAKIFIVWYLATVFSEKQEEIYEKDLNALFKGKNWFLKAFGGWKFPIIVMIAIEIIMPDLGNTVMMTVITGVMIGASGVSFQWFKSFGKLSLFIALGFIIYLYSVGGNIIPGYYVNARFQAMVDPFSGIDSYGLQMANSYYAVSNGGWFGRGLGNSIQKNGFLPEAHTDFIFAIVIEELGIVGGILILGVFFFMVVRVFRIGIRARSAFNSLICIGFGTTLLISSFVNIGGAFGIIPESGVTFPFISQGGSSFLMLSIGIAFVLNISAEEKRKEIIELSFAK